MSVCFVCLYHFLWVGFSSVVVIAPILHVVLCAPSCIWDLAGLVSLLYLLLHSDLQEHLLLREVLLLGHLATWLLLSILRLDHLLLLLSNLLLVQLLLSRLVCIVLLQFLHEQELLFLGHIFWLRGVYLLHLAHSVDLIRRRCIAWIAL